MAGEGEIARRDERLMGGDLSLAWTEVLNQFRNYQNPEATIRRLVNENCRRLDVEPPDLTQHYKIVRLESWSHDRLGKLIDVMARHKPNAMITTKRPRQTWRPLTVVRWRTHVFMIDGRRRANQWRHMPGRYPVMLVTLGTDDGAG